MTTLRERPDVLPRSLPPRGLSCDEAAAYIGVSRTMFLVMVGDGRMPKPKRINARTVWDRGLVDIAFDDIPDENPKDHVPNVWDTIG